MTVQLAYGDGANRPRPVEHVLNDKRIVATFNGKMQS
jgi:hypothetical protein